VPVGSFVEEGLPAHVAGRAGSASCSAWRGICAAAIARVAVLLQHGGCLTRAQAPARWSSVITTVRMLMQVFARAPIWTEFAGPVPTASVEVLCTLDAALSPASVCVCGGDGGLQLAQRCWRQPAASKALRRARARIGRGRESRGGGVCG